MHPIDYEVTEDPRVLTEQLAESQRFLNLFLDITTVANDVEDPTEFITRSLELICRALDRPLGLAWRVDKHTDQLVLAASVDIDKTRTEFIEASRARTYTRSEGLPGRVWQRDAVVWISDITCEDQFLPLSEALSCGVQSFFGFAIAARQEVIGVFEFGSTKREDFDPRVANFFKRLGSYVGIVYERKDNELRMHENESVLNLLVEHMPEAVFLVDHKKRLILGNEKGYQFADAILNRNNDEPDVQSNGHGCFHADEVTPFSVEELPPLKALDGLLVHDANIYIKSSDFPAGALFSVDARPLRDDGEKVIGAVVVARDITTRRNLQVQLQAASDEAIASVKLKSEFVANVSHEIRTPLAGILGMAELLTTRDESDSEGREIANYILQSAENLLSIVNELLDFSKLEAGRLTLYKAKFLAPNLLNEVARSISIPAGKKGIKIEIEIDPQVPEEVFGDHGRLLQILLNYGHNAVKFTESGTITLKAQLESKGPGVAHVRFSVTDTGIGVKEHIKPSLFEPFVQGDGSTTRRYGGTGLGLSIAKKLTDLMSGSVGLESTAGKGATVWAIVPLGLYDDESLI